MSTARHRRPPAPVLGPQRAALGALAVTGAGAALPLAAPATPAAAAPARAAQAAPATAPALGKDDRATATVHVVRTGENLSEIANALAVRGGWPSIYAENRTVVGPDPNLIRPGERLRIPVTRPTTTPPPPPRADRHIRTRAEPRLRLCLRVPSPGSDPPSCPRTDSRACTDPYSLTTRLCAAPHVRVRAAPRGRARARADPYLRAGPRVRTGLRADHRGHGPARARAARADPCLRAGPRGPARARARAARAVATLGPRGLVHRRRRHSPVHHGAAQRRRARAGLLLRLHPARSAGPAPGREHPRWWRTGRVRRQLAARALR